VNLWARLGLDASGFATGLAKAQTTAAKAGAQMGGAMKSQFLAFFGTAAIGAMVKDVIDYGGKLSDLAKRSFMSREALQEFDYIANQTGTTVEGFVSAEQKLAKAQQEALGGSKEFVATFKNFGISVKDLKRLNPHQLFMLLSSSIGKSNLSSRELTDVLQLMGKSAGDLVPAMKQGFDGMIERAHKLGLILSDEVLDQLDEVGDRLSEAKARFRGPAASIALYGVQKLEEVGAIGSGLGQMFNAMSNPGSDKRPWATAYSEGVDSYNQKVMDSVGAQSLIIQKEQADTLRKIEANTKNGEEGPRVF